MSLLSQSMEVVAVPAERSPQAACWVSVPVLYCAISHAHTWKHKAMYRTLCQLRSWTGLSWVVHFQRWQSHIIWAKRRLGSYIKWTWQTPLSPSPLVHGQRWLELPGLPDKSTHQAAPGTFNYRSSGASNWKEFLIPLSHALPFYIWSLIQ